MSLWCVCTTDIFLTPLYLPIILQLWHINSCKPKSLLVINNIDYTHTPKWTSRTYCTGPTINIPINDRISSHTIWSAMIGQKTVALHQSCQAHGLPWCYSMPQSGALHQCHWNLLKYIPLARIETHCLLYSGPQWHRWQGLHGKSLGRALMHTRNSDMHDVAFCCFAEVQNNVSPGISPCSILESHFLVGQAPAAYLSDPLW